MSLTTQSWVLWASLILQEKKTLSISSFISGAKSNSLTCTTASRGELGCIWTDSSPISYWSLWSLWLRSCAWPDRWRGLIGCQRDRLSSWPQQGHLQGGQTSFSNTELWAHLGCLNWRTCPTPTAQPDWLQCPALQVRSPLHFRVDAHFWTG